MIYEHCEDLEISPSPTIARSARQPLLPEYPQQYLCMLCSHVILLISTRSHSELMYCSTAIRLFCMPRGRLSQQLGRRAVAETSRPDVNRSRPLGALYSVRLAFLLSLSTIVIACGDDGRCFRLHFGRDRVRRRRQAGRSPPERDNARGSS
ncbi:hypothetical protein OE88DRAFT_758678 [Heliocybe sulcata]|uniref:Uncharacterized protein n=1 Tax=Heliocybe sulcata TaxID=5364 RepID=A0A5C3MS80_9AGAM|nr:hypothetical protein OE88DRAFT_758678 [Heliocybe sulcata]